MGNPLDRTCDRRGALARSAACSLAAAAGVAGLPRPAVAATLAPGFDARSLDELRAALGLGVPAVSDLVTLSGPDVAENGAAVELSLATTLPDATRLLLVVERNPAVLSALFELSPAVVPAFVVRVKMAESSRVWALATTADGRVHAASREIRVTLGGCAA